MLAFALFRLAGPVALASLGRKVMLAFALLRLAVSVARASLGLPPPHKVPLVLLVLLVLPGGRRACLRFAQARGADCPRNTARKVRPVRQVRQKHSPQAGLKKNLNFFGKGVILGGVFPVFSLVAASRKSK